MPRELRDVRRVSTRMTRVSLLALALLALGAALACGEAEARVPRRTPPYLSLPPHARQLCSEHVTGTDMHIQWTSHALRETVAEARAFYGRLGVTFTPTNGELTHAPDTITRVSLHPANGTYPGCTNRPNPNERSVVVWSIATR